MTQRRESASGERQYLAPDGYWYAANSGGPGIYQKPAGHRRKSHAVRWVVGLVVIVVLLVGGLVAALVIKNDRAKGTETRLELQSSVLTDSGRAHIPGVHTVSCIMPSSWIPGKTFVCFAYGSGGHALAQMDGTVLPNSGGRFAWNEQWGQ